MPPLKRKRHEIVSWWLPAPPAGKHAAKVQDKMGINEEDVKVAEKEPACKQEGLLTTTLKEGENLVIFDYVGEPKISIVHDPIHSNVDRGAVSKEKIESDGNPEHNICLNQAVLCIDVDNTTKFAAVKDNRGASNSDSADETMLRFYMVRRKRRRETKSDIKADGKVSPKEGAASESDEMSSSGYSTDDEKDDAEDAREEMTHTKSNGVQTEPLPEEPDVDPRGNPLYERPELLPLRQLRVLRDGDRIIVRCTPPSARDSVPKIAKLEYVYARSTHTHSRKKDHYRMKTALQATSGKPRLLSVKSDVKSDCKKKAKANDTSAAEAPSDDDDDDISVKATKDRHKAGKDWSAVDDAAGNGGNKAKNAQAGDVMEEMEEYSYLTGEIVMKDQDYVSALTGDEATMPPYVPRDQKLRGGTENDAATASAVVVGANRAAASHAGNHRASSPTGRKNEKEVSFDAKFSPKKTPSPKGKEDCEFQVTEAIHAGHHIDHNKFLTATSHLDNDEELSMEEELLSQPSPPPAEAPREKEASDNESRDLSQTQSLRVPFMREDDNADSNSSLSPVEEAHKEKEADCDDSTACSDLEYQQPPSQVEVDKNSSRKSEVRFSQLTANSAIPKRDEESDVERYHAETQFEPLVAKETIAEQANDSERDEDYVAETQFALPIVHLNDDTGAVEGSKTVDETEVKHEANTDEPTENGANATKSHRNQTDDECRSVTEETDVRAKERAVDQAAAMSPENAAEMKDRFEGGEKISAGEAQSSNPESLKKSKHSNDEDDQLCVKCNQGAKPSSARKPDQFLSMPRKSNFLSDDAIHRSRNGAMMTGSVGGANLGAMFRGGTDRDLLTSIALQLTPNLPEAALSHKSSEETTVVNDKGAKKNTIESNLNLSDMNTNENGSEKVRSRSAGDSPGKNSAIPSEVFFETPVKERKGGTSINRASSTSQRPKRSRRSLATPSSDSNEEIRIMFTGIDVTSKRKKVS